MPQDGSNNYQYPPGTPGIPDQTIESEAYNTFLDDLVTNDLNIPRPIHRGGTGASDATQALVNLGGEKSSQIVTNYDTQVFLSGSFYSAVGATNAPVAGHAFVGIAYSSDPPATPPANLNWVIEARDQNDTSVPGKLYVREKKAGVWGPWITDASSASGPAPPTGLPDGALFWNSTTGVLYVNYNDGNSTQLVQAVALPAIDTSLFALKPDVVLKAGDTMTGLLTLSGDPTAIMHAATKQYVDSGVGGVGGGLTAKVDKAGGAGGVMTGLLTLSGDPTAVLHAATKQYVDAKGISVVVQKFAASGTYTPTAGLRYCTIECGGGGGGGGGANGSSSNYYSGGGGGSGGYSRKTATAAAVGVSQVVTIGASGAGGFGTVAGSNGGATSIGLLCVANGGTGGQGGHSGQVASGGQGGTAGTGDIAAAGNPGDSGMYSQSITTKTQNANGGPSYFGGSGKGLPTNSVNGDGCPGSLGGGGGGAGIDGAVAAATGGAGGAGFVIVTEFL